MANFLINNLGPTKTMLENVGIHWWMMAKIKKMGTDKIILIQLKLVQFSLSGVETSL